MNICLRLGLLLLATIAPVASKAQNAAIFSRMTEAMALTPDLASGEHLYIQYCSACHKRSGWGSGPQEIPTLAGQQEFYILEQLMQFSASERLKVEMHEVVNRPEVAGLQALRDGGGRAAVRLPTRTAARHRARTSCDPAAGSDRLCARPFISRDRRRRRLYIEAAGNAAAVSGRRLRQAGRRAKPCLILTDLSQEPTPVGYMPVRDACSSLRAGLQPSCVVTPSALR
jgi:cytochrome c553